MCHSIALRCGDGSAISAKCLLTCSKLASCLACTPRQGHCALNERATSTGCIRSSFQRDPWRLNPVAPAESRFLRIAPVAVPDARGPHDFNHVISRRAIEIVIGRLACSMKNCVCRKCTVLPETFSLKTIATRKGRKIKADGTNVVVYS